MRTTPVETIRLYEERGWWGDRTFMDVFDEAVAEAPDAAALVDPPNRESFVAGAPRRLTFREVSDHADALALILRSHGVGVGDRVLVQLPNIAELPIAYLALGRLGAIVSPVAMQYGAFELDAIVKALDASAVITVGRFQDKDFLADRVEAYREPLMVFAFDDGGREGVVPVSLEAPSAAPATSGWMTRLLGGGRAPTPDRPDVSPYDVFTICWTSGTTGTPKGVPRHHNHWFAQTLAVEDATPIEAGEAMLNPFPLINMAALSGFFFMWPMKRARLVLHHPFDLPVFLQQMAQEKIVYTIAPPAVLNMLVQRADLHEQLDFSHARYIASGSAPLAPAMVQGFKELFDVEIVNFFGSNEGVGLCGGPREVPDPALRATLFPRFGRPDLTWSNRFAGRCRTKLVDFGAGDAEITAPGQPGELLIDGPNVFDGYLGDDANNRDVFDTDGYFRSGDLFEIAGEGELSRYYRFVGRRKDLIIRGGMNISPAELDVALAGHPKIADCAVVSYADATMGEKVALVATPREGETLSLADVTSYLDSIGMAKFKWPERLVLAEALPRNPLNKVVRHELKAFLDADEDGTAT
ncbi:MAG: acyl--CoA ligase [Caulobacterales bacterium]|nr:acyl--CoA ligase [Caulobacterales bacterium]